MGNSLSFLTGMGLGTGLMYMLDPDSGRRRRALARDKAVRLSHQASQAVEMVGKDMRNRAQGLGSGDLSVLVGGKRALQHPFAGGWSPSARAIMIGVGTGLFVFGLTRSARAACVLGTAGCVLAAEGITNAGLDDVTGAAGKFAQAARSAAGSIGATATARADRRAAMPFVTAAP